MICHCLATSYLLQPLGLAANNGSLVLKNHDILISETRPTIADSLAMTTMFLQHCSVIVS